MQSNKRSSSRGASTESVATLELAALEQLRDQNATPQQLCEELARVFHVEVTEVALLRVEGTALRFVFPPELREVGSIPLSSSAVAAHTATTKKAEFFNSFTKVKHASVFEGVKLRPEKSEQAQPTPIQKLMSAPVLNGERTVVGVIQVSRKGSESCLAGPDFTRDDLQQLELAAKIVAETSFMQKNLAR
jgi:hypothetical protein